ncbi:hypothetical protein B0H16DRAFT_1487486, partial [Mycena metata]
LILATSSTTWREQSALYPTSFPSDSGRGRCHYGLWRRLFEDGCPCMNVRRQSQNCEAHSRGVDRELKAKSRRAKHLAANKADTEKAVVARKLQHRQKRQRSKKKQAATTSLNAKCIVPREVSTIEFSSLFHIPGPWVHPATKSLASDSVDIAELARKIHAHVPEISRADGVKLLNAAKNDACGSLTNLSIFDRATYLTALEISNVPNYGMLNSRTLPNIKHGLATVLAVDMLLHCSDPPTSSHPPVPQRASRPGGNDRFDKHFLAYKSWRWVLVKGNKLQDKIKTIASRVDPDLEGRPERAVSRMLAYKNLNDTYQPGSVAEHNLVQVVFFFSALTKGYTSLSKTRVWDVAL